MSTGDWNDGILPTFDDYGCDLSAGPITATDVENCKEGGNSTCITEIKKLWKQMIYDWKDLSKTLLKFF